MGFCTVEIVNLPAGQTGFGFGGYDYLPASIPGGGHEIVPFQATANPTVFTLDVDAVLARLQRYWDSPYYGLDHKGKLWTPIFPSWVFESNRFVPVAGEHYIWDLATGIAAVPGEEPPPGGGEPPQDDGVPPPDGEGGSGMSKLAIGGVVAVVALLALTLGGER